MTLVWSRILPTKIIICENFSQKIIIIIYNFIFPAPASILALLYSITYVFCINFIYISAYGGLFMIFLGGTKQYVQSNIDMLTF